ncbi:NAD(P)-dependent oxidoreductase [Palleronia sp. LCG004]|uniref:NAD(P)-dependent oxidoreductase n=1 Tax=Palleronia sp. LCG004 TaxID=3079304 RepID=UPI002943A249|nr:NAD(P)-dependent oxidoreductase [Palleronia sp. LCG004]WOI57525.1 NAD(P)-dependent oxidoreductase [Palleronia sp. LCG004]
MNFEIGMIGVGLMGHGIARNVMRKGSYPLVFLDHPGNQPTDELTDLGATTRGSPAEIARAANVVILCVTGSPQVEAIVEGEGGLLSGLRPGTIVIDCSTALPASTLRMAAAVEAAGGAYLDAPMTRTARHAHEGKLNLLVGSADETLEKVRPVLDTFAENVTHVGPVGHGHRMKLLHNFVSIGSVTLLAEAAALAADADVDPEVLIDVLAKGGGAGAALDRLTPYLKDGDREGLAFSISNGAKDIGYYRQMSEEAGARHVVADGVAAAMERALATGEGEAYIPELVRIFRK